MMRLRQLVFCAVLATSGIATAAEARVDTRTRSVGPATSNARTDVTGTISAGGPPVTVTIPAAYENARITFSGTAGQRISLNMTDVSIWFSYVSIEKPDGSNLVSTAVFSSGKFIDTHTLPTTGTYTIFIDPWSTYTGSMTLTLYDVPSDAAAPIGSSDENVVDVSLSTPGQNGGYAFEGHAEHRVSLLVESNTINPAVVRILNPDGSVLASTGAIGPAGGYLDAVETATDGTYSVSVDPQDAATGALTLTLHDIPNDLVAEMTVGGRPTRLAVSVPGHNPTAAFLGTAGQSVIATIGAGINFSTLTLKKPDGSTLVTSSAGSSGGSLGPVTLPTDGEYEFVVDPLVQNTGSVVAEIVAYGAPTNTVAPAISGTAAIGETLSASTGTWSDTGGWYTYQWQHCEFDDACADIPGATASTYTLTEDEADGTVRVVVQTSNASGLRTTYSVPTATVAGERVAAPKHTFSYYVRRTDPGRWNQLGCDLGEGVADGTRPKFALVILFFGRPAGTPAAPKVVTFGASGAITLAEVKSVVQQFGVGYAEPGCAPASGRLVIAVGTSNDNGTWRPGGTSYDDANVTPTHGRKWGIAVNEINAYFRSHPSCISCRGVFAIGASDIETDFAKRIPSHNWIKGYKRRARSPYIDFGDAGGCPGTWPIASGATCNNEWKPMGVYWAATGARRAFPFPQIYTEQGHHTVHQQDQWYVLAKFATTGSRVKMLFRGTLAQRQRCLDDDTPPECDPDAHLLNTAAQAWNALNAKIRADSATRTPIHHTSDIRWAN